MNISAVILTYNAADTIERTLDSIKWCEEVVIVDAGSTDGTLKQVKKYDNTKIVSTTKRPPNEPLDLDRRIGIEAASHDWVLRLDADEWITQPLQERLIEISEEPNPPDIIYAPRANFVGGTQLQYSGMWPEYQPLLSHCDSFNISERLHQWFVPAADATELYLPKEIQYAIYHDRAESTIGLINDLREYAKIESAQTAFSLKRLLGSPLTVTWNYLILRQAYRDGAAGLGVTLGWILFHIESMIRSALRHTNG